MTRVVAIDIGGTMIKYGTIDAQGNIMEAQEIPTEAHKGGPEILKKVCHIIDSYLEQGSIDGIAISSAGMVDPVKGEIFYSGPQIPNYAGTQFKATLEEKYHVRTEIENDVNCAGLAEVMSGSAKGSPVAVCLTIGTGIGGCLVTNGSVFHGYSYSACEVGYMHLPDGAFQDLASTTALVEYVAGCHGDAAMEWNGKRIFEGAKAGDEHCIAGIDRMVDYLGQGLANICYVVNPQKIVLGGGIMAQKDYLKERLNKALTKYLVSSIAEKTEIVFAEHENHAGMLGAYYHFKDKE